MSLLQHHEQVTVLLSLQKEKGHWMTNTTMHLKLRDFYDGQKYSTTSYKTFYY